MPYCHPGGVHLNIGGGRDRQVGSRRGRLGRVCARGADGALLLGPSISPLGDRNETSDARTPIPGLELRQRLRIPVNPQNGVP